MTLTENGSGLAEITWYYKLSTETSYKSTRSTYTDPNPNTKKGLIVTQENITNKIIGLESDRTYNIYAEVRDAAGNMTRSPSSGTVNISTLVCNYSIKKSEDVTEDYNSLKNAINAAVSGGGDNGGGTITVKKSSTDNSISSSVKIDKTITINIANNNTLTLEKGGLRTTDGTLTISGTGEIYCKAEETCLQGYGGNIKTSGSLTIRSVNGNAIKTYENEDSSVTLEGGYIYSENKSCIVIEGGIEKGIEEDKTEVSLNNTKVFAPRNDKSAIYFDEKSKTQKLTINGESYIGNARDKNTADSKMYANTVSINNPGVEINVQGSTRIMSGAHGAGAIALYGDKDKVIMVGSSSLYAINTEKNITNSYCIGVDAKECGVTFASTGYFYSTADYVVMSKEGSNTSLSVAKGNFVSRGNKYMFWINGAQVSGYVSNSNPGKRHFSYMDNNTVQIQEISDCYYLRTGI